MNSDFWVVWFYIANHDCQKVSAKNPEDAIMAVTHYFSDDFKKKARIMVFDKQPAIDVNYRKNVNAK